MDTEYTLSSSINAAHGNASNFESWMDEEIGNLTECLFDDNLLLLDSNESSDLMTALSMIESPPDGRSSVLVSPHNASDLTIDDAEMIPHQKTNPVVPQDLDNDSSCSGFLPTEMTQKSLLQVPTVGVLGSLADADAVVSSLESLTTVPESNESLLMNCDDSSSSSSVDKAPESVASSTPVFVVSSCESSLGIHSLMSPNRDSKALSTFLKAVATAEQTHEYSKYASKMSPSHLSEAERVGKRRERNRELAKQTRRRKKQAYSSLQDQVTRLFEENLRLQSIARIHMEPAASKPVLESTKQALEKVSASVWDSCGVNFQASKEPKATMTVLVSQGIKRKQKSNPGESCDKDTKSSDKDASSSPKRMKTLVLAEISDDSKSVCSGTSDEITSLPQPVTPTIKPKSLVPLLLPTPCSSSNNGEPFSIGNMTWANETTSEYCLARSATSSFSLIPDPLCCYEQE